MPKRVSLTEEEHRKNFWLNVIDGSLFLMAIAIIPWETILPAYVKRYTSNEYIISFIPAIRIIGMTLPQIFGARMIERLRYRKPVMLLTGLGQRVPWLFLGFFLLLMSSFKTSMFPLIIFFTFYTIFTISTGINMPIWLDVVAKVTPVNARGKLFAYRNFLGGVLGLVGAKISEIVLKKYEFPISYSILFLLFFILTSLSLWSLLFLKEPPSLKVRKRRKFKNYIKAVTKLIRTDKNYLNYIIASLLLSFTMVSGGIATFYTIYGVDKFNLHNKDYIFAQIKWYMVLANLVTIFFFGYLADKKGHKINLVLSSIFMIISTSFMLLTKGLFLYFASYVLYGMALATLSISSLNITLEFGKEEDRPIYISIKNTLIAPISFLMPFLASFLVRHFGYLFLFYLTILANILYLFFIIFFVKEPRK